jgi:hypothetical protein
MHAGPIGRRDRAAYPLGEAVGEGGVAAPLDAVVGGELPRPLRLEELQALVERAGVVVRRRVRRRRQEEERGYQQQGGRRLGHQPRHGSTTGTAVPVVFVASSVVA